jgi:hypothetical protein
MEMTAALLPPGGAKLNPRLFEAMTAALFPSLLFESVETGVFFFFPSSPMGLFFLGRKRLIDGDPSESVATVGPKSFSPSSWYY